MTDKALQDCSAEEEAFCMSVRTYQCAGKYDASELLIASELLNRPGDVNVCHLALAACIPCCADEVLPPSVIVLPGLLSLYVPLQTGCRLLHIVARTS